MQDGRNADRRAAACSPAWRTRTQAAAPARRRGCRAPRATAAQPASLTGRLSLRADSALRCGSRAGMARGRACAVAGAAMAWVIAAAPQHAVDSAPAVERVVRRPTHEAVVAGPPSATPERPPTIVSSSSPASPSRNIAARTSLPGPPDRLTAPPAVATSSPAPPSMPPVAGSSTAGGTSGRSPWSPSATANSATVAPAGSAQTTSCGPRRRQPPDASSTCPRSDSRHARAAGSACTSSAFTSPGNAANAIRRTRTDPRPSDRETRSPSTVAAEAPAESAPNASRTNTEPKTIRTEATNANETPKLCAFHIPGDLARVRRRHPRSRCYDEPGRPSSAWRSPARDDAAEVRPTRAVCRPLNGERGRCAAVDELEAGVVDGEQFRETVLARLLTAREAGTFSSE